MKSYFLESPALPDALAKTLSDLLPGQENPWLLKASSEDPVVSIHVAANANEVAKRTYFRSRR